MSKIIAADFTAPDAKTRNLMQRMGRFDLQDRLELICNGFDKIVFRTRFTLADQVLLHGLVAIGADVQVVDGSDKSDKNTTLKSLIAITQDAYAVKLSDAIPQDAGLLIDSQIRIGRKSSFAGKKKN